MDIKATLAEAVVKAATEAFPDAGFGSVHLEVPPKKEMGDFATNFAMQSAKALKRNPRQIAAAIVERLKGDWLEKAEIAGPGFINFYLWENVVYDNLAKIFHNPNYGQLPPKKASRIQVEYVSANPTGPLHVGHGRGAAAGSAIVNLLRAAGYDVESEYYINDAGNQIDNLAASVNARYLELMGKTLAYPENEYHGEDIIFPENGYRGGDIIETARRIVDKDGAKYLDMAEEERLALFKELALKEKLAKLKEDLAAFRVNFDVWFSERRLHSGAIEDAIKKLQATGDIYEQEGALWLKSTAYGDDKDRVVVRAGGEPTYLAADIAYHRDKYERGFGKLINVWGADHHGYVCRVKAAMTALGYDADKLTILLLQMVSLYRGGELVKMSKRTGQSVTLAELIEEVGADAARYFFLMRSLDSQLDFDLDLAKSHSNENPVYYIQYAHARIASIGRQAAETGLKLPEEPVFSLLTDETELDIIKKLASYEEEIERAAAEYAPQRIAHYAYELAGLFHGFYNKCRIIGVEENLAGARLALVTLTARTIRHALGLLGVSAPEKM